MNSGIFGTSGIRGIVNTDLTPHLAVKIGSALATYIGEDEVVALAYDSRTSSQMLEFALISGLLGGGCNVKKLGLLPTPALAFLTKTMKAKSGIMITASHNPPEYNGFKIFNEDSMPYSDRQQVEINRTLETDCFKHASWQGIGDLSEIDETDKYISMILNSVEVFKKWRIALDFGCGATCQVAPKIFGELGNDIVAINAQPDGFFPGRIPEPTNDSLKYLCQVVKNMELDLGIAYDGDGDRMVAIDENGRVVLPDHLLAAYAAYVVRKHGKGVIIVHVDTSMCVDEIVEAQGGRVLRTRVGDVNIASGIIENGALFGGEPIGAWIHPEHHFCPDGLLSSVLLLEALEDEGKTLSQFVSIVPSFPVLRGKISCPNDLKMQVLESVKRPLIEIFSTFKDKSEIDGLRLDLDDGWLLIRSSGTEPNIRVTAEALHLVKTREMFEICVRLVKSMVEKVSI